MASNRFPFRKSDDNAVEKADQVLRARYYQTVRSYAESILQEAKQEGYEDFDRANEFLVERIHETADGAQEVIYTHKALQTLVYSDRWQAVEDTGMELPDDDLPRTVTIAAYYALSADIAEQVEALQDEYFTDDDDEDED